MTVLEDKIRKNKEHYDVHEPAEGHKARFATRLDAGFHGDTKKKSVVYTIMRYAAGVLIVAAVATILLFQYSDNSSLANAGPMDDELNLMIEHYNRLTDQKLDEISACTQSEEEADNVNDMAEEQLQSLEEDAQELKEKLREDVSDERVYGALVNNYRTRIKILNNIITNICQM